jgi:hypothetical protein
MKNLRGSEIASFVGVIFRTCESGKTKKPPGQEAFLIFLK